MSDLLTSAQHADMVTDIEVAEPGGANPSVRALYVHDVAQREAIDTLLAAARLAQSYLEAQHDPDVDAATIQRGHLTVWSALRDAIRKAEGRR